MGNKQNFSLNNTQKALSILAVGSIVVASVAFPGLPAAISQTHKFWKNLKRKEVGRIIKRLQKQELIRVQEDQGKITLEITDKGKHRLLEYDYENIQLQAKKRDKKWRLILFDIPEPQKSARDLFRRKLLQLGMIRLQDSIFVSAFPCKKEVDFLCHFLGISDFVTIVTVDNFERGEDLIFKEFGIVSS